LKNELGWKPVETFESGIRKTVQCYLANASARPTGASVFAYHVHDPERYGVVAFDAHQRAISIEEKPQQPKSHYAVTGLYFYVQKRYGLQLCCPEEIAFVQKWIDAAQIQKLAAPLAKNGYGQYLLGLIK
jgi:dTDP-glucose pyrophosphorylase